MPTGLQRFQQTRHSHFITFSCCQRRPNFNECAVYNLFLECLEEMRRRFRLYVYGYVVMPEHVHLLVSEPEHRLLAEAVHFLKLSFAKRLHAKTGETGSFWQKRYYDRNVRDAREFEIKLRYLHRNPVNRELVQEPAEWRWSSFRHYALRERGVVEIESEWTARDRERKTCGEPAQIFLSPG